MGQYRISLDSSLMLFIKTLIAFDAICLRLDPSFNLAKVTVTTLMQPEYQMLFTHNAPMPIDQNGFSAEKTSELQNYYTEWLLQLKHQT